MKISKLSLPANAFKAAEPVSPLVAPSIKDFCLLLLKILSKSFAKNCIA